MSRTARHDTSTLLSRSFGFALLLLCLLSVGLPAPLLAQAPQAAAIDELRPGGLHQIGDRHVPVDAGRDILQRFRRARQAWVAPGSSLAYSGRDFAYAHALIAEQEGAGMLALESALIARFYERGQIPLEQAQAWVGLFDEWGELDEGTRVQRHLHLRLRALHTVLELIPTKSLPEELDAAGQIAAIAAHESSIPGRKIRSRVEPPPPIDVSLTLRALASAHRDAMAAALLLAAVVWPHHDIVERYGLAEDWAQTTGPAADARALAQTLLIQPSDWARAHQELQAIVARGFEIPNRWLWRIATHRYLMGDRDSLYDLRALHARWTPASSQDAQMFALLGAMLDPEFPAATQALPSLRSAGNPTWRWIIAEGMRRQGRVEEAAAALQAIVDSDGQFIAAWFSLAAARNAMSHGAGVLLALDVLEEIAPPLPIYAYWLQQLRQQHI